MPTEYKDSFQDDIDADTIHASFQYPVAESEKPTFNWNLSNYDIIVIDELSMVSAKIFDHIFNTISELPITPLWLLAGDNRQLQPIEKVDGTISTAQSVMMGDKLNNVTIKSLLTEQHRTDDNYYPQFLQHIRFWRPSQCLLNKIQHQKILFHEEPTDDQLLSALTMYPNSTVITVSHRASNRVNKVVIENILNTSSLLGEIESDCSLGRIPIYKGMRVMITQNRNKQLSIVNGRLAHIVQMQGKTVFLKLANDDIVQVYPTSSYMEDNVLKTVTPIMPAYALTIPKAQEQTLKSCIIWLDNPVIAPGGAYVALSRCKTLDSIRFLTPILPSQITPVPIT